MQRSAAYDANVERLGDHSDTCFICGRRTAEKLMVHYTTAGELTNTTTEDLSPWDRESQGCFPIGPECAKKLPKGYVFKS